MTGDGGSAVGRAVAQLTASLGRSDEARTHSREALTRVIDSWAFHRQAGADTDSETMVAAIAHGASAQASINRTLALLAACDEGILRYVERIAPGLKIAVSNDVAGAPDGSELLQPAKRPRTLREVNRALARDATDVNDLARQGRDVSQSIKELFRPPDPASMRSTTEPAQASPTVATGADRQAISGDPLLSVTVITVVLFEYGHRVVARIIDRRKRNKS